MMRVALVLATSTGGVGQHVRSLAFGLVAAGHRVVVLGPAATEEHFGFTKVGARFRAVEIAAGLNPVTDLVAVSRLRTLCAGADVVHAHGFRAGLVAGLARRTTQPFVVTWHNALLGGGIKQKVLTQVATRVARSADITLAASEDLATAAQDAGGRDVRFSPVGAPELASATRTPAQVRAELGMGDAPFVLSVGRLHAQKSFDVLIAAAAQWARRSPAPVVAIAGSGPLRDELSGLILQSGADVRLLGHREDVADLLAACDLAVVTSQWEARQLFAQEALHAGRPLVATAVGGLPGLLGDVAVLVPHGDVEALAMAVSELLDDPARAAQLAQRGAQRAKTWPGEADTVEAVSAVYSELL